MDFSKLFKRTTQARFSRISQHQETGSAILPVISTLTLPEEDPWVSTMNLAGLLTGTRLSPSPLTVTRPESTMSRV